MAGATLKPFSIVPDGSGFIPPCDYVNSRAVIANTAESISIPDDATHVIFSANVDFFANWTTTATIPADVNNGQGSELNPTGRFLGRGTSRTVSVITAADGIVQAHFYRT